MNLNVTATRATKPDGSDGAVVFSFVETAFGNFDLTLTPDQALHAAQDIMSAALTARRPQLQVSQDAMQAVKP